MCLALPVLRAKMEDIPMQNTNTITRVKTGMLTWRSLLRSSNHSRIIRKNKIVGNPLIIFSEGKKSEIILSGCIKKHITYRNNILSNRLLVILESYGGIL